MTKRYKSAALRAAHETATSLHRLGLIDTKTMRDFDVSCLTNRKAPGKGNRSSVTKEKTSSFKPLAPNEETMEAMKVARRGELITAGSPNALLEKLKAAIKEGLYSGEPTPLDVEAIKTRGRKRLAAQQKKTAV